MKDRNSLTADLSDEKTKNNSFLVISAIELWERFGYYGATGLLLLYLIDKLGLERQAATLVVGAFSALVFISPMVGGWIADSFFGTRRSMLLGTIILASGYFLLSLPLNGYYVIYVAMAIIVVGNGLFKPNAGNMVRKIYEKDERAMDSAFTIYYMSVNIGSAVSLLLTPWLKETFDWHWAFAACTVGLILGLANYVLFRRMVDHIGNIYDFKPLHFGKLALVLIGGVAVVATVTGILLSAKIAEACVWFSFALMAVVWVIHYFRAELRERMGLRVIFVLVAQSFVFFLYYQQSMTSLLLFAKDHVTGPFYLFGYRLFQWGPAQYYALNPIWIMIASPLLALLYTRLARGRGDMDISVKFLIGFVLLALGCVVWWLIGAYSTQSEISPWWMVVGYFFFSVAELFISGLGLSFIARFSSPSTTGFMMGGYFLMSGISQYVGSVLANFAAVDSSAYPLESLRAYGSLYFVLLVVAIITGIICFTLIKPMARWEQNYLNFHENK